MRVAALHPNPAQMRTVGLVNELSRHVTVVGVYQPTIGRAFDLGNKLNHFHPWRRTWRARAYFNKSRFDRMSRSVAEQLAHVDYDVALQLYPVLFCPPKRAPYGIYTDNTMASTQRSFREWAKLSKRETARALASERDTFRGAAFVATSSTQALESAVVDYGCDPARVTRVGPGLMLTVPESVPVRTEQQKSTVLFVATSFWPKGGATLLDAWETVEREAPGARLVVIGPREKPRKLPSSVVWLGPLPHSSLPARYESAGILVHPSHFESSIPNAIREAMAYGLAVVGSNTRSLVEDFPLGEWLFPIGDATELSARLLSLLLDHGLRDSVGLRLHDAAKEMAWPVVASRLLPLMRDAVENHAS